MFELWLNSCFGQGFLRKHAPNEFCSSFIFSFEVCIYCRIGDTLQNMLPWSCTKKKRAAHKGMEHTLECDASCIGKLESKTTSAKIFQSKTPMMSHSLHSWSRQDGLLPQEFVSPLLHKIPGTLTTIGQLHVRKFLARARSFFAITS